MFKNIKIDKKSKILLLLVFLGIVTITCSFAFFMAYVSPEASAEVNIGTVVSEKLIFTPGNDMILSANQENFGAGDGSLSTSTSSTATLIANSSKVSATDIYHVYFDVTTNDFVYSHSADNPELLLTITDPEGNVITNIEGLTYKTITDASTGETISGFDITEYKGIIKVKEDHSISTTSSTSGTTQEWSATITFVNLETNQAVNEGKSLDADFILTQDKIYETSKMVSALVFQRILNGYSRDNGPTSDSEFAFMIANGDINTSVKHIEINSTINEERYNNALNKWDVSLDEDNSVVAYMVEDTTETGSVNNILYIESNNIIEAHPEQGIDFELGENLECRGMFTFAFAESIEFNDSYDTKNVMDMRCMFYDLVVVESLDLSSFDTGNVESMYRMFNRNLALTNLDLSSFDTSKVTDMSYMFSDVHSLTDLNLSSFDTSNVTDMSYMFNNANSLTNVNITSFRANNLLNMEFMFYMTKINNLDLSRFNASKVTSLFGTFADMSNLATIDLSSFDMSSVENIEKVFLNSDALNGNLNAKTSADAALLNDRENTFLTSNATFVATQ